ncbi:hypothetical protein RhiirA5_447845 [Rhizophagus irregularis]|uniref:Uncharacterized protein n=1 Tax=Rhizophagus irregularis TaxID=588596 RepID=A0A2N0NB03_9GLOM|nr:hypothetical protein RhiirA5_447845 [Rhizophagus irregularis]
MVVEFRSSIFSYTPIPYLKSTTNSDEKNGKKKKIFTLNSKKSKEVATKENSKMNVDNILKQKETEKMNKKKNINLPFGLQKVQEAVTKEKK